MEWYPLGRLLLWIAATAALVTVASGVVALGDGDYETFQASVRKRFEGFLRPRRRAPRRAGDAAQRRGASSIPGRQRAAVPRRARSSPWSWPSISGSPARSSQVSGRLPRPWPFIPATAMPHGRARAARLRGRGRASCPGFVGVAGLVLTGALVVAFALQGLAFLHDRPRGAVRPRLPR